MFEVDEANRRVKIIVSEDQLSLAIGKRGQNARLTSKLTGWHVDIEAEHVEVEGFEEQKARAIKALAEISGITEAQAEGLVNAGITSLETLLQVDEGDLDDIPALEGHAAGILEAARSEFSRRSVQVGGTVTQ
jgi:N utilization substance protein A